MTQSILYGNGLNLLSEGCPTWNALIESISNVTFEDDIPNTLKYEAIIMRKPYCLPQGNNNSSSRSEYISQDGTIVSIHDRLAERELKEKLANSLRLFNSNDMYDRVANLPVSHFITTNYDNLLFRSFASSKIDSRTRLEKLYSIRRHYQLNTPSGESKLYWPIHGCIDKPESIMLGYDHYCGSIAKITNYIKGTYQAPDGRIDSMTTRLRQDLMNVSSWIDLFFISDIHIIGLGLGYEEMDLWWLLNRRRRIKRQDSSLVENKIYYYPVDKLRPDKKQLLLEFGVEIKELDDKTIEKDYIDKYQIQISAIENNIR